MFIAYFFCQLLSILHLICVSPILTGDVNQVLPANGYSTTSIGIQYTNENSRYIPVTGNTNENSRYIPVTGNTNENDRCIPVTETPMGMTVTYQKPETPMGMIIIY
jgi:hypothetical protein